MHHQVRSKQFDEPRDLNECNWLGVRITIRVKVVFVVVLVTGLTALGIVKAIDHFDHINPESFSTETIASVIRSISLAMTFLLGLFVNNAVVRWWGIVKDMEDMLGSGEKLIMMLIHVNADRKMREDALRRVIIACEMLRYNAVWATS